MIYPLGGNFDINKCSLCNLDLEKDNKKVILECGHSI
jgi:hypothetical protein